MTEKNKYDNIKITIFRNSQRLRHSKSDSKLTEDKNILDNKKNKISIKNNNRDLHISNSNKNIPLISGLETKDLKEIEHQKMNTFRKRESSLLARKKIISRLKSQETDYRKMKNKEDNDDKLINNNNNLINKKTFEENFSLMHLSSKEKYKMSLNIQKIEIILPTRKEKNGKTFRRSKDLNNSSDQINKRLYSSSNDNDNTEKKNKNIITRKYCSYYSKKLFDNPLKNNKKASNIIITDNNKIKGNINNNGNINTSKLNHYTRNIRKDRNITSFENEKISDKNNKKTYRRFYEQKNRNKQENENNENEKIKSRIIVDEKNDYEKQKKIEINNDSIPLSNKNKNKYNSRSFMRSKQVVIENTNIVNNFIVNFFEELIDISEVLEIKNLLSTLLNNFNIKYFTNYKSLSFPEDITNFEFVFKHYCIILVSFIFLSFDNTLYILDNVKKVKNLFNQTICSSLNYLKINNKSNKISNFLNKNESKEIIQNKRLTGLIINTIFDNNKEYLSLQKALNQLLSKINLNNYKWFINIINNTILFYFNNRRVFSYNFDIFKKKSVSPTHNNTYINSKFKFEDSIPTAPYIKSQMKKNFCLVLDIDETIAHSLKLSLGYYFLLRPGTIEFLSEISNYYEIIIFTSSPKNYADNILNKIDSKNNLISHRLYRDHVVYENGKVVKKLKMIGRDLKKTIFVDNLKSNAKDNPKNLYPISAWYSDVCDRQLFQLKDKLIYIATCGKYIEDITKAI